ncbi:MAG TPA: VTT domain-containing protein [Longimicrobiales bacterium]|nr:VTT domain-containing protein [Longimicrobiales bacterium]
MSQGAEEAVPPPEPAARRGPLRRLYDWVLHWAETPYGAPALFGLALAESSFFPIPPDPLLIALCLGAPGLSLRFAANATIASVLGGILGYGIGAGAWHLLEGWFFAYVPGVSAEAFARVQGLYDNYDFWAVFLAGLTPIPYKVFTLSAGVFSINFPVFVVASVLSRGLRFFLLAGLIFYFGQPITRFIDRYFNLLAWAFGLLLVGGFLVIELVL